MKRRPFAPGPALLPALLVLLPALLVLLPLVAACGPAWRPARPARVAALHDRLDRLELAITKDDDLRKNRLRETVAQTKELDAIGAERFLFANAVARLWSKLFQDLEGLGRALDVAGQGIGYVETKTVFERGRLDEARATFDLRFGEARRRLLEVLCARRPEAAPCRGVPATQEKTP